MSIKKSLLNLASQLMASNHGAALSHSRSQLRVCYKHLDEETLPFTNSPMPDWRCFKNHVLKLYMLYMFDHSCTMQLWPLSLTASTWTWHIMAWHNHEASPRCHGLWRDAKKFSNLWPWVFDGFCRSYTHHIIPYCAVALWLPQIFPRCLTETSNDIQPPSSGPTNAKKHFKVNLLTV